MAEKNIVVVLLAFYVIVRQKVSITGSKLQIRVIVGFHHSSQRVIVLLPYGRGWTETKSLDRADSYQNLRDLKRPCVVGD